MLWSLPKLQIFLLLAKYFNPRELQYTFGKQNPFDCIYLAIKPTICNYNIIACMLCLSQDFKDLDICRSIAVSIVQDNVSQRTENVLLCQGIGGLSFTDILFFLKRMRTVGQPVPITIGTKKRYRLQ